MKRVSLSILICLAIAVLISCGGGKKEGDTTPPTVTSTNPANDAIDVVLDADLSVTFSESIDSATVTSANFSFVDDAGTRIQGNIDYDVSTRTASFTPKNGLTEETTYTATISALITDLAGNPLEADYSWHFTTVNIPPTITSVSPGDGANNAPLNTVVSVTFSEGMDASTITTNSFTLVDASNKPVGGVVDYRTVTHRASFTPTSTLKEGGSYTAKILKVVSDLAGNKLEADYSWQFSIANIAPTVDSTKPIADSSNVPLNTTVSVTFSEAVNESTITSDSFTLMDAGNHIVAGDINYDSTSKTATFTPTESLLGNTDYTVTITTDVKDLAGNALAAEFSWQFTTTPVELELREITLDEHAQLIIPEGFHALGDYSRLPVSDRLAVRELRSGALAAPVDYQRACGLSICWKPIPPPGYRCLGLVLAVNKPDVDAVRCVREDLTTDGVLGSAIQIGDNSKHIIPRTQSGIQAGTYSKAWEFFPPEGPWGNASGMDTHDYYYGSIQSADLDGDGQDELLARASNGMQVYKYDATNANWDLLDQGGPFKDANGYTNPQFYYTIQTADVDGDGKDELLARASTGMQVYDFDATKTPAWILRDSGGPFTDAGGWNQWKFYSTIQTADLDGDGQFELLGRSSSGMQVYRFDAASSDWELLAASGPFPSSTGWDNEQFNSTIQTADVDGDGKAEVLARSSTGMQVWKFDTTDKSWESLSETGPFSDAGGWNQQEYYLTIQTADVDGDGRDEVLGRGANGMTVVRFNSSDNSWRTLNSSGPFTNAAGWDQIQFYSTIQTADIDGDGRKDLLARSSSYVLSYSYKYDALTDTGSWQAASNGPPFGSETFDAEDHYLTMQTADINGDGKSDLLIRGNAGMLAYQFVATNLSWAGANLALPVIDASKVQLPATLSPDTIEQLIADYAPVMILHPDEQYFPDDPQWVLDNGTMLAWGLVTNETSYDNFNLTSRNESNISAATLMDEVTRILDDVKPYAPYDDSPYFRYWLEIPDNLLAGNLERAKAVIRVVPWNYFSTEVQFWIFYPFNGPGRIRTCLASTLCDHEQLNDVGKHYGDWEQITLRFRNRTQALEAVFMSAHAGGRWYGTPDFGTRLLFEDTHPKIFSAKYSHAHYPSIDRFYYERVFEADWDIGTISADLYDDTAQGETIHWGQAGRYGYISFKSDPALPVDWLDFAGRWGEYLRLSEWIYWGELQLYRYTEVSGGPSGPGRKTPWDVGSSSVELGYP